MEEFSETVMNSRDAVRIVRNTLNLVDGRLVDHGERVAFILDQMLWDCEEYTQEEKLQICILGIFHDIGAYKTDEIDRMVQFETKNVWEHSVYGYLFLKYFTPFQEKAEAILYHHAAYSSFQGGETKYQKLAMLISLADRVDIYLQEYRAPFDISLLEKEAGRFDPQLLSWLRRAESKRHILRHLLDGTYKFRVDDLAASLRLTNEEMNGYLFMLVYSIDFRSAYTVTHTMNTVTISVELAKRMGDSREELIKVFYGALLHDMGKIAIPLEILEYPGKLSFQAMEIMKTHVVITQRIIRGIIRDDICDIAVRHHEKLDGSGYPRGLTGGELTRDQRIVAVADIISALSGRRSYKEAWPKERIRAVLEEMSRDGKLCPEVCATALRHYDSIMSEASRQADKVLRMYADLMEEYERLLGKLQTAENA